MRSAVIRRLRREPRPESPWRRRFDTARDALERRAGQSPVAALLAEVEEALVAASADQDEVTGLLVVLDPERVADELKAALRSGAADDGGAGETMVEGLRRRYQTVHALQDRAEDLDYRIETILVDLEELVARSVATSTALSAHDLEVLGGDLQQLRFAADALATAHRELDEIGRGIEP